jgi:hypothetical protein
MSNSARAPVGPSRATRAISALYLVGGIVGSVVAVTGDYPGLPLGIDLGLTTSGGVWIGWGSGVSAPWPLLVALALTGVAGLGHKRTVPVLGLIFVLGGLIEPIFWEATPGRRAPQSPSWYGSTWFSRRC